MIKCICCEKNLQTDPKDAPDRNAIVLGAIPCFSHGAYGSSEYDPFSDLEHLEFYLCDECLLKKAELVRRIKGRTQFVLQSEMSFAEYEAKLREIRASRPEPSDEEKAQAKLARQANLRGLMESP